MFKSLKGKTSGWWTQKVCHCTCLSLWYPTVCLSLTLEKLCKWCIPFKWNTVSMSLRRSDQVVQMWLRYLFDVYITLTTCQLDYGGKEIIFPMKDYSSSSVQNLLLPVHYSCKSPVKLNLQWLWSSVAAHLSSYSSAATCRHSDWHCWLIVN